MTPDFDREIARHGTFASKWHGHPPTALAMDVGDMDFAVCPAIIDRMAERLRHPVLGYDEIPPAFLEAGVAHLGAAFGWRIEPSWIICTPGIVAGMAAACRALCGPHGRIFHPEPVYQNIRRIALACGRPSVAVPMRREAGRWRLDLEALLLARPRPGDVLLLCNPHNPLGQCHLGDELLRIARVCEEQGLEVVSDESFCDLVLHPDLRHVPFGSLQAEAGPRSVTLVSPSKSCNIPGANCALMIVPDGHRRRRIGDALDIVAGKVATLSVVAAWAAYETTDRWRRALIDYLRANVRLLMSRAAQWKEFRPDPVEAGFLAWIDVAPRDGTELVRGLREATGVVLAPGLRFGVANHVRLNFGCPQSILVRALDAIESHLGATVAAAIGMKP